MAEPLKSSIRLSKPLKGVRVSYHGPEPLGGDEVHQREEGAYVRGYSDADNACQQQIAQARDQMRRLQDEVLAGMSTRFEEFFQQFDNQLPDLVLAIVHKVLAGIELDRKTLTRLVQNALDELAPGSDSIELHLSPRDADLLQNAETFATNYPGIRLKADKNLKSGDVVLHSRFGVVDARVDTKLGRIGSELKEVQE